MLQIAFSNFWYGPTWVRNQTTHFSGTRFITRGSRNKNCGNSPMFLQIISFLLAIAFCMHYQKQLNSNQGRIQAGAIGATAPP